MVMKQWNPFQDLSQLQERMNRLFEESISRTRGLEEGVLTGTWSPSVDIHEVDDGLMLIAELPGVSRENLQIDIKENILTLKGERRRDMNVKEENYYRMERYHGPFNRTFTLPDPIESGKVTASLTDGLLEIRLPKMKEKESEPITVSVE